jgi:hypothetical protein
LLKTPDILLANDSRLSVSYRLSNGSEKASLVWKDQSRYVGFATGISCADPPWRIGVALGV